MVAALHSYTHTTYFCQILWFSVVLMESKGYHYVMDEAYSQLKLLYNSIVDMYIMIEHID